MDLLECARKAFKIVAPAKATQIGVKAWRWLEPIAPQAREASKTGTCKNNCDCV